MTENSENPDITSIFRKLETKDIYCDNPG